MVVDAGLRLQPMAPFARLGCQRYRAFGALFAALAEGDADDAARRIGVVVGPGHRDDFDFLDLLGPQRLEVAQQLVGFHAQFAVVDVDFRARFAVDRNLVAVHPDARCQLERFDAVPAEHRRGVGYVDHEAVGFAADKLGAYYHIVDLRGGGVECQVAQVGRRFDAHLAFQRLESDEPDGEGVVARRNFQREAALGVGRCACGLQPVLQQNHRREFHGVALLCHHTARGRVVLRPEGPQNGHYYNHDEGGQFFHIFCC